MPWRCATTFFFFQAEDGIRYRDVTGVQTCALPIYLSLSRADLRQSRATPRQKWATPRQSRSEERRVGKGVDLGGRRIIKKKIKTGAERMPHDLSHLGFLAGKIGRIITISTTPVIAGDYFEMAAVGALRLSPLRRGLAIDSIV